MIIMPEDLKSILNDLSKLSPEQRLKRLKQLQEEKQKQIDELKKKEQEEQQSLKQAEELLLESLKELMDEEKLLQETREQNRQETTAVSETLEETVGEAPETPPETTVANIDYGIPKEGQVRYLTSTQQQANAYTTVKQIANKIGSEGLSEEDKARLESIARSTNATKQYLKGLPQEVRENVDHYNYIKRIDRVIEIIKREEKNLYKHSVG